MANIIVKCPVCGESFQADDSREFAFCTYCGCKVALTSFDSAGASESEDYKEVYEKTSKAPCDSVLSSEDRERKEKFLGRCNQVITFCNAQLNADPKKRVNSEEFFKNQLAQWTEAMYKTERELGIKNY